MRLASYKGTRRGIRGLFNIAVRWWLTGQYSHTELVFSDDACFSCSFTDGRRPRIKWLALDPSKWDFVDLPETYNEADVRARAEQMVADGQIRYSLLLLAAFVFQPLLRLCGPRDEVCSTVILRALGVSEHKRYDPVEAALLLSGVR